MFNTHVVVLGIGCGVLGVGCGVLGVGCGVLGVGCGVLGVGCGIEAVLIEPVLEEDVLKIKMKRYLTLHWKY